MRNQVTIRVEEWNAEDADLLALDERVRRAERLGPFTLAVRGGTLEVFETAVVQIFTRYQRLVPRRNDASNERGFDQVLGAHRTLYRTANAQDKERALDRWQWLVRLEPECGEAAQVAALFARFSTEVIAAALADTELRREVVAHAQRLVVRRAKGPHDDEIAALDEAEALSFLSLDSWRLHEPQEARALIGGAFGRLGACGRQWLSGLRLPPVVHEWLATQPR